MWRLGVACLLSGMVLFAGEGPKEEPARDDFAPLEIRVSGTGKLEIDRRQWFKRPEVTPKEVYTGPVTLNRIAIWLETMRGMWRLIHDGPPDLVEKDLSGRTFKKFKRGMRILVDEAAPWAWVQWLSFIGLENHIRDFEFQVHRRDGKKSTLSTRLHAITAWKKVREREDAVLRVKEDEKGLRYEFGRRRARDVDGLSEELAAAIEEHRILLVRFDEKITAGEAVSTLSKLQSRGLRPLWWLELGRSVAPAKARDASRLPRPE